GEGRRYHGHGCRSAQRAEEAEQVEASPSRHLSWWSPRHTRWLLLREAPGSAGNGGTLPVQAGGGSGTRTAVARRQAAERVYLDQLCTLCPAIATAWCLVHTFLGALQAGNVARLQPWLERVAQSHLPELDSFAYGLQRDRAAVEAAFQLPWSSGQLEGQLNRLKTLKRQMYGRASFALLRRRVLSAA